MKRVRLAASDYYWNSSDQQWLVRVDGKWIVSTSLGDVGYEEGKKLIEDSSVAILVETMDREDGDAQKGHVIK